MRASVLSIGSELLRGDIVDTNAAFLTRELTHIGLQVSRVQQIGDDLASLTECFRSELARTDVIVCTGGLGPTQDDLTREAIAAALEEDPYLDPHLVAAVESRFASMHRRMPESNRKQAMLIPSAEAIPNANGSAPGWYVQSGGRVIAALPGPPSEMRPMWNNWVADRLQGLLPGTLYMTALMTFGIGESTVEERIRSLIASIPEVTVATYAKTAGVQVHITARGRDREEAERLGHDTEMRARELLGDAVFGTGEMTLAAAVGSLLDEHNLTLAVMESATGGELSTMITNNPGSSKHFLGGIIAYSKVVKQSHGVSPEVMDKFGLISAETAVSMAQACRRAFAVDVSLSVTGIAGTESMEGKEAGTCFVAMSTDTVEHVREIHRPGQRETSKHYFAQCALDLLRRQLASSSCLDRTLA